MQNWIQLCLSLQHLKIKNNIISKNMIVSHGPILNIINECFVGLFSKEKNLNLNIC
jgi:hypothetical protein